MSVQLTINQVGLPAGKVNRSRSDGLLNGAIVTIAHSGLGTASFALLWVPEDDTTAVSSLAQVGNIATFTPNTAIGGTYRILVTVVVENVVYTEIRLFGVRTQHARLRIMALNERADESASIVNKSSSIVNSSEFNEKSISGPFYQGDYGGWYSSFVELIKKVEQLLGS